MLPGRLEIAAAAQRIEGWVRRTPVLAVPLAVDGIAGRPVTFKLEYVQHSGSFKARGAFNRLLSAREAGLLDPQLGVVTASGGNAGLAVAYVAGQLQVPAEVWVPASAPAVKRDRLALLGAKVQTRGEQYAHALEGALDSAACTGALFCHAFDQPEVVAGQGTLGLELADQVGDELDTVIVSVGGGGLMAGVAAALTDRVQVVAVEPVGIPTLRAALAAGGPVDVEVAGLTVDSLGARRLGEIAFAVAVQSGVTSVLVTDDDIVAARRRLWQELRIVVEHGAAAAFAALSAGVYRPGRHERVAVVLCGANTDPSDL